MQPTAARSPGLNFFTRRADAGHAPDHFVARHAGISCPAPFIADDVDIRVADAAKKNLDLHVMSSRRAALDGKRRERRFGAASGVSFCLNHRQSLAQMAGNFQMIRRVNADVHPLAIAMREDVQIKSASAVGAKSL